MLGKKKLQKKASLYCTRFVQFLLIFTLDILFLVAFVGNVTGFLIMGTGNLIY